MKKVPLSATTSFYRNPEQLAVVVTWLHAAVATRGAVSAHVFAQSSGQETWTLLFEVERAGLLDHVTINASDVRPEAVLAARKAVYGKDEVSAVPLDVRTGGFGKVAAGYKVRNVLRSRVRHKQIDIGCMPAVGPFDLILCQNVLVHMEQNEAEQVLANIAKVQAPGGLLALGGVRIEPFLELLGRLGYRPLLERVEAIYEGWTIQRRGWQEPPKASPYWALPPFDRQNPERCCSLFVLGDSG